MKTKIAIAVAGILAGCSTVSLHEPTVNPGAKAERREATPIRSAAAISVDRYKRTVAQHIAEVNNDKIYPGHPQALLRSVVVVKYVVDANGKLIRNDTFRSNGDNVTVATALSALRNAAPFPQPPTNLLSHGRLELLETMLFNDDGRFQLRSIAARQLDE
jgi:protein TonB